MQNNDLKTTRQYSDHETVPKAMEGTLVFTMLDLVEVVRMYEARLKEINPYVRNITYDVRDLHNYIDHLTDMCALV